jgi:hypothetical protein
MTDEAPGPGQYELFFSVRHKRLGVIGTGQYGMPFTIPADQDGAHAALAMVMADMAEHVAQLIGIPPMEHEPGEAQAEPEPSVPTGPNGEFPPDIELIYRAFRARMASEDRVAADTHYVMPREQAILAARAADWQGVFNDTISED